ncbi:MAG: acyltransferase [Sphingomonas sp.]|uniref:acyltransferase family protein n=1 Tax=Sphingomonas sp. TaxID=28214 RepID=UPI0025FE56C3|nr:acyltransferase family protein [Sphingomonas sp.]MBX3565289.1 acyltransferase [Sphingomonas sp.]
MPFAVTLEGLNPHSAHYRPEIDGLRAVAVVSVMLFHAGIAGFGGGFTGVDIFYVISGYLITGIILRETAQGGFTLSGFYVRRARRILPALFTVMFASFAAAWVVLFPDAMDRFGQSLLASLAFGANFFFWRASDDYFAPTGDLDPLLHLWSLSVEEQFYLFYPLMLVLLVRRLPRLLLPLLALGLFGSFALSEVLSHARAGINFYMLPTRGWELLAGALLAVGEGRGPLGAALPRRLREAGGLIGLLAVLAPMVMIDRLVPFPGVFALPTVSGTMLLITFARPDTLAGRLLASRPAVAIGLLSYSAYLWHQPLLAFSRAAVTTAIGMPAALALLLLAFVLAALTWRFVERPFRGRRAMAPHRALLLGGPAALLLAGAGLAAWRTHGLPQRYSAETLALTQQGQRYKDENLPCFFSGNPKPLDQACKLGASGPVTVAIIGDSHASAIAPAFVPELDRRQQRAATFIWAGCPPSLRRDGMSAQRQNCPPFYESVFSYLRAHKEIGTVVFAARWTLYMEHTTFDNGEGGWETMDPESPATPAGQRALAETFREAVRAMLAAGKRVVLVYPVPEAGWNVPNYLVWTRRYGFWVDLPTTSHARFVERNRRVYAAFDALGTPPGLVRVYPEHALCPPSAGGRCLLVQDGWPLYYDDDHLNRQGARFALPDLRAALGP